MKVQPRFSVRKAAVYAIVINALQIAATLALALCVVLDQNNRLLRGAAGDALVLLLSAVVIWGAAVDIREALAAGSMTEKLDGLDETVTQMTDLNHALRAQRHDFLNHLQVVYSLIEMGEYGEANRYIEQVYGSIQALSRVMKTACAPVNALILAKTAEAEEKGIQVELNCAAAWENLPLPAWEMCRVLSNLLDNAMDALAKTPQKKLTITLSEDVRGFAFEVRNNGPMIEKEKQAAIFTPGISTKGQGRGMGLYIARKTLRDAGGDLTLVSTEESTAFSGFVPRPRAVPDAESKEQ